MNLKKKLWISVILLVLIFSGGCTKGTLNGQEVKLNLFGFPSENSSYVVSVSLYEGNEVKQSINLGNQASEGVLQKNLKVNDNITDVVILLKDSYGNVSYFYAFAYDKAKVEYSVGYWLDYDSYLNGYIGFGYSKALARPVTDGIIDDMDFSQAPYYLYEVSGVNENNVSIHLKVSGGEIRFSYGEFTDSGEFYYTGSYTYDEDTVTAIIDWPREKVYILVYLNNYGLETKCKMDLNVHKQVAIDSIIKEMVPGSSTDVVYAVGSVYDPYNPDKPKLFYINPLTKNVDTVFDLPGHQALSVSYSKLDNKLYILDESYSLNIWDLASETVTTKELPLSTYLSDMEIDPVSRRLYIISGEDIHILNMDNPSESIATVKGVKVGTLKLDQGKSMLYAVSSSQIFRYSVVNDSFVEEEKISVPYINRSRVVIDSTNDRILFPDGNTIQARNALNLFELLDVWQFNNYISNLAMSPDGSTLFAVEGGNVGNYWNGDVTCIYIADAHNPAVQPKRLSLENSNYSAVISTNSDGSKLVGYREQTQTYNNLHYLCFFDDVTLTAASNPVGKADYEPAAINRAFEVLNVTKGGSNYE